MNSDEDMGYGEGMSFKEISGDMMLPDASRESTLENMCSTNTLMAMADIHGNIIQSNGAYGDLVGKTSCDMLGQREGAAQQLKTAKKYWGDGSELVFHLYSKKLKQSNFSCH